VVAAAAPAAAASLARHVTDPRPRTYTREQLERGTTGDIAWNAAQREMVATGRMHGYMRMYWAKQLLLVR
jgi:deoxyribodipyrimidine photo-lyase